MSTWSVHYLNSYIKSLRSYINSLRWKTLWIYWIAADEASVVVLEFNYGRLKTKSCWKNKRQVIAPCVSDTALLNVVNWDSSDSEHNLKANWIRWTKETGLLKAHGYSWPGLLWTDHSSWHRNDNRHLSLLLNWYCTKSKRQCQANDRRKGGRRPLTEQQQQQKKKEVFKKSK